MSNSQQSFNTSEWSFPVFVPNPNGPSNGQIDDSIANDVTAGSESKKATETTANHNPSYRSGNRAKPLPTTEVWGVPFAIATMDDAIELADQVIQAGKPEYFITANLNYLMLTEEHPELHQVNNRCFCFLADGNPIVWRSRLEPNPLPCRVAGSDMIIELARLSADKGYRIFFLGGAPGVAEAAANTLQSVLPELQIAGTYSPPFRQLSPQEHEQLLARIRDAKTDILLVAFGQPKGELWIYDNLHQLNVPLSIQLGASFDFLAGTAKRAPRLWQKIGCEWLYRAFSDPKRLLPRYGKNLMFLAGLMVHEIGQAWQRILKSLPRP